MNQEICEKIDKLVSDINHNRITGYAQLREICEKENIEHWRILEKGEFAPCDVCGGLHHNWELIWDEDATPEQLIYFYEHKACAICKDCMQDLLSNGD